MPDLATMQAARPKCPAIVKLTIPKEGSRGAIDTEKRCDEPMRWSPGVEAWVCPLHGRVPAGVSVYEAALRDA